MISGSPYGIWLPGWTTIRLRDLVADLKENLEILDSTGKIPIRFDHVRRLVIVMMDVFVPLLDSVAGGLTDVIDARAGFQGGHIHTSKFVVIGAEVEALLGCGIAGEHAALPCDCLSGEVVES